MHSHFSTNICVTFCVFSTLLFNEQNAADFRLCWLKASYGVCQDESALALVFIHKNYYTWISDMLYMLSLFPQIRIFRGFQWFRCPNRSPIASAIFLHLAFSSIFGDFRRIAFLGIFKYEESISGVFFVHDNAADDAAE